MKWTDEHKQYLVDHYDNGNGLQDCVAATGFGANATKQMARRLGVASVRRNFTQEEINYITKNYSSMGPRAISKELNLNWMSVYTLAQRLHLKCDPIVRSENTKRTNKLWVRTVETRKKQADAKRKYTEDNNCISCGKKIVRKAVRCQLCNLKTRRGENHNFWKGGVSDLYRVIYHRLWKSWKIKVLKRDDFRCQDCGEHQHLEVHHIRKFVLIREGVLREHPELSPIEDKYVLADLIVAEHRLEDGITLCYNCHKDRHFEKQDELLESPNVKDEGNQQPSRLNVIDFVSRKVQRLTSEDTQTNKLDTSVLHTASPAV
jgi:5-methylcytosine-specific restriction endonuclease McrA